MCHYICKSLVQNLHLMRISKTNVIVLRIISAGGLKIFQRKGNVLNFLVCWNRQVNRDTWKIHRNRIFTSVLITYIVQTCHGILASIVTRWHRELLSFWHKWREFGLTQLYFRQKRKIFRPHVSISLLAFFRAVTSNVAIWQLSLSECLLKVISLSDTQRLHCLGNVSMLSALTHIPRTSPKMWLKGAPFTKNGWSCQWRSGFLTSEAR